MSGGKLRVRVLSAYRNILQLARGWTAIDPEQTAKERDYIRREAQTNFRENKEVTDPAKIVSLVEEAEARLAVAHHYGIPYERPPYLPPAASYGRPVPESCPIRAERRLDGPLADLPADLRAFARLYFAGSPIDDATLRRTAAHFAAESEAGGALLSSDLLCEWSPKRSYEVGVLKRLLAVLENEGVSPSDNVYERLCQAMGSRRTGSGGEAEVFHRVYFNVELDDLLVICENAEQISGGTTGLACWQAACLLAEYFRCGVLAEMAAAVGRPLAVLELGAGCGLAGLSVAKFIGRRDVACLTLTDHNERVLARLRENVALNFGGMDDHGSDGPAMDVCPLDWTDCEGQLEALPRQDVIVAADVVYDPDIIPAFCNVLSSLLSRCPTGEEPTTTWPVAYVACTLRNADTFALFREELSKRRLSWTEFTSEPGEHCFRTADGLERFRFDEVLFPSSSALCLPVVIMEIRAEPT